MQHRRHGFESTARIAARPDVLLRESVTNHLQPTASDHARMLRRTRWHRPEIA
jgi:hypothetical protein